MIVFSNEERAYLYWVAHHRGGFVLDYRRKPGKAPGTLHRATCPEIRSSATRRSHWTTGPRLKACSLDREELVSWALEQSQRRPADCTACLGGDECSADGQQAHQPRLTRLGREVLTFVLEVAVYHMDEHDGAYALTVGAVAKVLRKTPGQLSAALRQLVAANLFLVSGQIAAEGPIPSPRAIFPTARALRTLPAFESLSDRAIAAELRKLSGE